jgi:hypothetical protein
MQARIFRPAKSAMQSGRGGTQEWVMEFDEALTRTLDPLTGWTSVDGTSGQVRLTFATREEAVAYARQNGFTFEVTDSAEPRRLIKNYSENFSANRKRAWTH